MNLVVYFTLSPETGALVSSMTTPLLQAHYDHTYISFNADYSHIVVSGSYLSGRDPKTAILYQNLTSGSYSIYLVTDGFFLLTSMTVPGDDLVSMTYWDSDNPFTLHRLGSNMTTASSVYHFSRN